MIIEKKYNSNLINFEDLKTGECFKSIEDDRFETKCTYYIKLRGSIKEKGIIYNAIRLDDGAFWSFKAKDKIHKIKAKIVIEDFIE